MMSGIGTEGRGGPVRPTGRLKSVSVGKNRTRCPEAVSGPEGKGRLWPELVAMYPTFQEYQKKTERELPVIVLRPAGGMPGGAEGREDSR
jgi:hypothetical protein